MQTGKRPTKKKDAGGEVTGEALFCFPVPVQTEHKYHSLTVICHVSADGWDTCWLHMLSPRHTHTHKNIYKTDTI